MLSVNGPRCLDMSRGKSSTVLLASSTDNLEAVKGTYAVVLWLERETRFPRVGKAGRFGELILPAAFYVYVGSAHGSGGVKARIGHHLRNNAKKPIWHLDSLRPAMEILEAWVTYDGVKRECVWSMMAHNGLEGQVVVPGLGSADCNRCEAHFYRFARRPSFTKFRKAIQKSFPGHASVEKVQLA